AAAAAAAAAAVAAAAAKEAKGAATPPPPPPPPPRAASGEEEKAAKRRKSRRSGAGVRVTPVGSGGRLGETGDGSDSDGGGGGSGGSSEGPPMVELSTKDEVHQALAGKLRECDKRDAELNDVIEKATAELERNNERRKAAVAESEKQLLSIIAKREAKIALLEKASQRAQNNSDRESLRAHKEQQAEQ
ncbi:unnamed protein product, partial [Hapterophycus canaliculatus]